VPKYLFIGSYTPEGTRGVLKEGGTGRRGAILELMASVGGKVEGYYFAFGSDDVYIIVDLPGPAAAAAASLAVAASDAARLRTVVLLTPEELDAATKLKATYRPPYRSHG
jgi:uncharacterized protein with GYD domain